MALGCRQGQGFLYARGLPADEAGAYIALQPATHTDRSPLALIR
jgi:EAL domain-containing protein (putative c-di-GMP-specific phosphodiesterase class I)